MVRRGGVFPVIDGQILLIRHFRNARRDWSLEVPRGAPVFGLSPQDNARQEISEEVQGEISRLEHLGRMENNNGMVGEIMHVYFAELSAIGAPNHSEGIDKISPDTSSEFAAMVKRSEITDCHTIVAYTLAKMNNLLP